MQTYELIVKGRAVRCNSADSTLVRTSVGIDQVHVLFDSAEWLEFPLTVTFAQSGVTPVTQSLVVSEITDSAEWVAEATVTVPYEVIEMNGSIRVTFQGTDSNGRHIITAKGAPLSVEEAGDVAMGEIPADAPTVDQWNQAYADAMVAVNAAQSVVNNLQEQLDAMVAAASDALDEKIEQSHVPATEERLGEIIVGGGLSIDETGILSTLATNGVTAEQVSQLANLGRLATFAFDTSFDADGILNSDVMVKATSVPIDGTTIGIDDDGKLHLIATLADTEVY